MTTSPTAQPTTRCARCEAPKAADLWLCPTCYRREPFVCAGCGGVDALAHGLCADCAARDAAILDPDPDQPIPFELTPRALALLAPPSGEAACPTCGRVRGVVYDGAATRCYGCWHRWVSQRAPTPSVA
jgi:hypothetical protein